MNAAKWVLLICVAGGGQVGRPGVARAQAQAAIAPAGSLVIAPAIEGDDNKPWNRGVPTALRRAARDRFVEGNRLFNVPLFAQAARQYEDALAKWKHPAFYFNLAFAQLNLGQDVEAHASLEHALEHGPEVFGADQVAEARRQLLELERHLGRVRITCQTSGAEVTLDGATVLVGPGSYQGWTKAQPHELTAKKAGYLSEARRVTARPGRTETIDLKLVTLSEATDTSRRWAAWKPWAVVGAGAVIAAASAGVHAISARGFNDYDSRFLKLGCSSTGCTDEQIRAGDSGLPDVLKRARLEQKLAVGGYIAGGAVIATGVVLLYMNRPRVLEQEGKGASAGRVAVVPTISADMLGVTMTLIR